MRRKPADRPARRRRRVAERRGDTRAGTSALTLGYPVLPFAAELAMSNDGQIEYWNGPAGRKWVDVHRQLDVMLSPITAALLDRAAIEAGERVVDVGCGCGDTTIAIAEKGAAVWGIDISEPMLAVARSRRPEAGEVAFSQADASSQTFTPDHSLVFSRFGVMFFDDPRAAFGNLRTALTAQGRVCFACWQPPNRNPWIAVAGAAVQPFLPEPSEPPDPRAPGPFAFSDADYQQDILSAAGFTDITIESFTPTLRLADTLDGAMTFLQEVGPLSRALVELDDKPRQAALDAAREALAPFATTTGLEMGAACWLTHARASQVRS
jgi:SAM-dependent methyltransferase